MFLTDLWKCSITWCEILRWAVPWENWGNKYWSVSLVDQTPLNLVLKLGLNWIPRNAQCKPEGGDNCKLSFIVQELRRYGKITLDIQTGPWHLTAFTTSLLTPTYMYTKMFICSFNWVILFCLVWENSLLSGRKLFWQGWESVISRARICHVIDHLETDIIQARMQYCFHKEAWLQQFLSHKLK